MFDRKKIRALAKAMDGEESVEYPDTLTQDTLLPSVGNRFAYEHRDQEPRIHVLVNLSDVGKVNSLYGHDHGGQYIRSAGEMLSKEATSLEGETYRLGGDTFAFLFEKPQQAEQFLRAGTMGLKEFPPIGAYGQPSFCAGMGPDLPTALRSLETAKQAKRERHGDSRISESAQIGHGLCYIHSALGGGLVPGEESPVIPEWLSHPKRTESIEASQPLSQA